MAGWPPEKNAAFIWYFYIRDADGDLVTGATSLDVERSIDGAAFGDVAGTEVDEGEGLYSCPIAAGEMDGDVIALICKTATAGAKTAGQVVYTTTRQIDDLAFPVVSGRGIDVEATGEVGLNFDNTVGTIDAAQIGADAITAAKIADSTIIAANFVAGAIDAAALNADAVDKIVDQTWDELLSAHSVDGSIGQAQGVLRSETATAGGVGTITLDASAPTTTDLFQGAVITIVRGLGVGQSRIITAYSSGRVCSTRPGWAVQPDATSQFIIQGYGPADLQTWKLVSPSDLITGAVVADVSVIQAGAIDAAAIATGAIDADAIATDAITNTKIAAGAVTSSEAPNLDAAITTRATPAQVATELGTYDGPTEAEMNARTIASAAYFDPAVDDVDVRAIQANVVTAAAINADAITAAKLAADVTTEIVAGMNDISTAEVLTQVNAALDTAIAEIGVGVPPTTPTLREAAMLLYMALARRLDVNTSGTDELVVYNEAGTAIAKKLLTDAAGDYSEAKMITGA